MNSKIYYLSDSIITGRTPCSSSFALSKYLFSLGIRIDSIMFLPSIPKDNFSNNETFEGKQNINFFLTDTSSSYEQIVKTICSKLTLLSVISPQIKTIIQKKYNAQNLPIPKESESFWLVPEGAHIVGCSKSDIQGIVVKSGCDSFVIMSCEEENVSEILPEVMEFVGVDLNKYKQTQLFKCFGLKDTDIKNILSDLIKNKDKISITTFANNLDVDILIKSKFEQNIFDEYVNKVFSRLANYIYAEEDVSIEQALFKLLQINNIKLSICESISSGRATHNLLTSDVGSKKVLNSSYIFDDPTKICDGLSASEQTVKEFGKVSVETIYEIATNLVLKNPNDIVCVTLGYLTQSNQTTCFIAIGDANAIHVYKNIFSGDWLSQSINSTKAAYFYLIKKLRKNDFHFNKKTV